MFCIYLFIELWKLIILPFNIFKYIECVSWGNLLGGGYCLYPKLVCPTLLCVGFLILISIL